VWAAARASGVTCRRTSRRGRPLRRIRVRTRWIGTSGTSGPGADPDPFRSPALTSRRGTAARAIGASSFTTFGARASNGMTGAGPGVAERARGVASRKSEAGLRNAVLGGGRAPLRILRGSRKTGARGRDPRSRTRARQVLQRRRKRVAVESRRRGVGGRVFDESSATSGA
jgi:hypothetical protein